MAESSMDFMTISNAMTVSNALTWVPRPPLNWVKLSVDGAVTQKKLDVGV